MAYYKWLPYQTYDVTDQVKSGTNHLEVSLGNGWYKGRYGITRDFNWRYGDQFALICETWITYEDGSTDTFSTGEGNWKARKSQVIDSSIYDGEIFDAAFIDDSVYSVKCIDIDMKKLEPRRSPATIVKERIKPIEIIRTPAGETVLDMGQNMVGWLEFKNRAPKGAEIHIQFGEVLQEGNFYRDNLRTAKCEYKYISDGEVKKVHPWFTFYGLRYAKLTQWEGEVNLDDFTGLVLYSDMEQTGSIETDHPLVNQLFQNAMWGQKGNYLDVPTDCPQRDERMGWTGDAQMFSGTAAFNMDVFAFFDKYLYDLMREQRVRGGTVPVVVPAHSVAQNGSCAWGDAAVIIPWNMYLYYGDLAILKQQYESMKGWVDYIRSRDEASGNRRLWVNDFHYGDWLSLDVDDITNRFGGTEPAFLASAYYSYSSGILAKAARILGKEADAAFYSKLSEEVKLAIRKEYFTETGRLAVNTQTAHVVSLYMDLIPEKWKERIATDLRLKLKSSSCHLRTGVVGTPDLCRVLSEHGSNDYAYRLLTNMDYPGWLYPITMGATTIWERWNSILPNGKISDTGMNSLNHYAYGSIVEWMYRNVAGIKPVDDAPGFRHFVLAPQPNPILKSINAEFRSPAGKIISRWSILEDGSLSFYFKVPFNTTASLTLPDTDGTELAGVHALESGEYTYRYMPKKPYIKCLGVDTSMKELQENKAALELVKEYFPSMGRWTLSCMAANERSIRDYVREGQLTVEIEKLEELDQKLALFQVQ